MLSSRIEIGRRFYHLSASSSLMAPARRTVSTVQTWLERARSRGELAARSDLELQDMGTCRTSIAHEISKPFWRA
jgi:uncharacterized protein YjiS (DUF1127 family)